MLAAAGMFYHSQHPRHFSKHIVICEVEDPKPKGAESGIALAVRFDLSLVDWAVDFDNDCCRMAIEIHYETSDDLLPAKMKASETVGAKELPQSSFRGGRLLAELSG